MGIVHKFSVVAEPIGETMGSVKSSVDVEKFIRGVYEDIALQESFYIVLLNFKNEIMGYRRVSMGGITATIVDPLVIAKVVVEMMAKGVVLVHNHPSGTVLPSDADVSITKKIKEGLALFDVRVIDHLILAPGGGYYSFADEGRL